MRHRTLIAALAALASAATPTPASAPRVPSSAWLANIPPVSELRVSRPAGPLLRRAHDLFALFSAGAGEWRPSGDVAPVGGDLPWDVAPGRQSAARFVAWPGARPSGNDGEGMLAIVLRDGERWCSPSLALREGSRLRFEAVTLGPRATLAITTGSSPTTPLALVQPATGQPLDLGTQSDLPLPAGETPVCFEARGGKLALGEGRILEPDPEPRRGPRWIVIFGFDDLRGDVISAPEAPRVVPGLLRFAGNAQVYRQALSPGSHTFASLGAIQTGRDPLRIDPSSVLSFRWAPVQFADAREVLSRPNSPLFLRLQDFGYHTLLFGHNAYLLGTRTFARYSIQGDRTFGTVDNVARMAPLFSRYSDERIALLVWVSATHVKSSIPRRLYDQLGCATLRGAAAGRCLYDARARHGDEAFAAFESGIEQSGLAESALRIVLSDHGEQFSDGTPVERFSDGRWTRSDRGHGETTDWSAVHVPLLLEGPGISPGIWDGPVSTLDIVPTIEALLGLPSLSARDGEPLPLVSRPAPGKPRRFVSYGFCSQSDQAGATRLVWWDAACGPRRLIGPGAPGGYRSELWRGRTLESSDRAPSPALIAAQIAHERWISDRLPGTTLILDFGGLGRGRHTFSVSVPKGRIVDWGPSGTAHGFRALRSRLVNERRLEIEVDGYAGRYAVVTRPALAATVLEPLLGAAPVVFVGPRQIPMQVWSQPLEPSHLADVFVAAAPPPPRPTDVPALRLWWQRAGEVESHGRDTGLQQMNQVLRAWGYIR